MKIWRIIAAGTAAFALAAIIGCNADSANDENNNGREPALQDEGQSDAGGANAPANEPLPDDEGVAGDGPGAEPSTDAGGSGGSDSAGDQPVDLPMPVDPQTDDPAQGEGGADGDGGVSILPVPEPDAKMEILPAGPETSGSGSTAPDANFSTQGGGDPNTAVEHRASIGGSDAVAGTGPSAPADFGDGREPAPVVKAMPAPGSRQ